MKTNYLNNLILWAGTTSKFIALFFILFLLKSSSAQIPRIKMQSNSFSISGIDKTLEDELRIAHVYSDSTPVSINRLRLLKIEHFGFDGEIHCGEIIVLDACSISVLDIFKDLFNQRFPIERMRLLTDYNGSDSLSMVDNNTSGHNFRPVTGGKKFSLHSYGTAIDINPFINPFVKISGDTAIYSPVGSIINSNRMIHRINKQVALGRAEEIIDIFEKHGFYFWGGYWDTPIDYQHFEISREITEILTVMQPAVASEFFTQVTNYYNENKLPMENVIREKKDELGYANKSISQLYKENNNVFNDILKKIISKSMTNSIHLYLKSSISP